MGFSYLQLRTAELANLVTAAQADDRDDSPAMNEIIQRFDAKARRIAHAVCLCPANREDVANAARLALVRAVRRHRADRGGFIAYAAIFMTRAARRESVRLGYPGETSLLSPDGIPSGRDTSPVRRLVPDYGTADHGGWGSGRIAKIIASLPQPQQTLLTERYIHDLELAKIAQTHGSSVSAVSQRLRTAHRHVARKMPSAAPYTVAA